MKRTVLLGLICLCIPFNSQAVEFRTPGTALGIGGAGVARDNGGLTSYWNPAAGAFKNSPLAVGAGVGGGIKGSDGLAENVDRLSNVDFGNLTSFNTSSVTDVGNFAKAISIIDDISKRSGNISITGQVPVGVAINSFSFGIFGNISGYILPVADMTNILPQATVTNAIIDTNALFTALAGAPYAPSGYFTTAQLATLATAIQSNSNPLAPLTPAQSQNLANAIDNQLLNSSIPADQALSALKDTALPILKNSGTATFNKNTTSVLIKAIQYIEVPFSYGYPIKVGTKGTLGVGITAKLISGTVYQNQVLLANRSDNNLNANDLLDEITNNQKRSSGFGVDLGALYRYDNWLGLGLVAKNINSPKFTGPDYFKPQYNNLTNKVEVTQWTPGESVELKPQVRAGIAADVLSWVNVAADLDLTENETIAPGTLIGSSIKSKNFGGGVEIHPVSWLKVRGGAYKNLSASNGGGVLTAGFKVFLLDVDGAFATNTFKIDGRELPQEVQINASLNFSF